MTDWQAARDRFRAIRTPTADDLAAWAHAAWWLGLVDELVEVGGRAYAAHLANGDPAQAATAAIGVAINLSLRGGRPRPAPAGSPAPPAPSPTCLTRRSTHTCAC